MRNTSTVAEPLELSGESPRVCRKSLVAAGSVIGAILASSCSHGRPGKAHAAADTRGLVKLIIHSESHKILGAHADGVNAAEIIHLPLMAIRESFTIDDLIETVHAFPTYAEAWKMCAPSFTRKIEAMSCCIV